MQKSVYENSKNVTLESISKLVNTMSSEMDNAIKKIQDINEETHILALNAAIEASSAGDAGKGFGVVAEHMGELSNETARITKKMNNNSQTNIVELEEILTTQAASVRGNRLANLALTNIDLIDRNLYERTADVRWWATEKSVVNALTDKTPEAINFVSGRLNTILKYYSIYHDLILADADGNIIANGNPQFNLKGRNISERPWFKNAIKTKNGDEFGFESVHNSPPINNQNIITFSCKVHSNGDTNQPFIGVLGTVFNWTGLAQKIVNDTTINEDDKPRTRVCIVNKEGIVFADTQNKILEDRIQFDGLDEVFKMKKNFITKKIDGKTFCMGHAISPGFEGYSTGWHSLIIQEMA
ncbi:chemotaxis protein [Nitrosopumilus sp. b1]|uniref:cache domain-containing protein n=1 Tax=Nitrosopumilus sp. b1 TaxID=2109907 RepID=UPI0015F6651C|nr:methyl-accepting chemotaxis protein [Nitrosopumilus sp. b1]KAF6243112.1 chemotaxis protein [Nitrosopumilus sp. b1]